MRSQWSQPMKSVTKAGPRTTATRKTIPSPNVASPLSYTTYGSSLPSMTFITSISNLSSGLNDTRSRHDISWLPSSSFKQYGEAPGFSSPTTAACLGSPLGTPSSALSRNACLAPPLTCFPFYIPYGPRSKYWKPWRNFQERPSLRR